MEELSVDALKRGFVEQAIKINGSEAFDGQESKSRPKARLWSNIFQEDFGYLVPGQRWTRNWRYLNLQVSNCGWLLIAAGLLFLC